MSSINFDRKAFITEIRGAACRQSSPADRLDCKKTLKENFEKECPEGAQNEETCAASFKLKALANGESARLPAASPAPVPVAPAAPLPKQSAIHSTLYIYSIKGCPPCMDLLEQWEEWKKLGYCPTLNIKKLMIDEAMPAKEEWSPDLPKSGNIDLPFVALRKPDGTWQKFEQLTAKRFTDVYDYAQYLWLKIDACNPAKK